jgi:hypothetical protein
MNRFLSSGQAIMFGTVLLLFPVLAQAQGSYEAGYTGTYQDATTGTNVVLNQPLAGGTAESTTDEDRGWRLRLDLSWVNPSGSIVSSNPGTTLDVGLKTGFGVGVRGEYQYSDRFGVEVGVLGTGNIDMAWGFAADRTGHDLGVSGISLISVGLNVHLTPESSIDLYLGPQLALVNYSSIDYWASPGDLGVSMSVDDDVGWGAILGLDVPLGDSDWVVNANVRYLNTGTKFSSVNFALDSNYDPIILSLGVGYRF